MNNKNSTIYEQLWLRYFNDTLLAKGIITDDEYQRINIKITAYKSNS